MKKLDEIIDILQSAKPELVERFGLTAMEIFGSYSRNEQNENSDVDILIDFSDEKYPSLIAFIGIQHDLEDKLGIRVDLISKNGIKPRYRKYILNETILI